MNIGGFSRGNLPQHWHSIDTLTSGPLPPQNVVSSTGGAWPVAETAIYVPLAVRSPSIVKKIWFAGASTGTGNYDIGLYDAAGVKLLAKGSTAKTTAGVEVVWDCTDTFILPGVYYFALVSDSATDTFLRLQPTAPLPVALGIWTEASAFPLPATATFAIDQTLAYMPVGGLFLDTRVA